MQSVSLYSIFLILKEKREKGFLLSHLFGLNLVDLPGAEWGHSELRHDMKKANRSGGSAHWSFLTHNLFMHPHSDIWAAGSSSDWYKDGHGQQHHSGRLRHLNDAQLVLKGQKCGTRYVGFCCCSPSSSTFDVSCVQWWSSVYLGYNHWLFELPLVSKHSAHRPLTSGIIMAFLCTDLLTHSLAVWKSL